MFVINISLIWVFIVLVKLLLVNSKVVIIHLKTFYIVLFYFRKIYFYIYIYYNKVNDEINTLKTVGHRTRFFSKNDVEPLPPILTLCIWIFSHLTYQVLNLKQNTNNAWYVNCVH